MGTAGTRGPARRRALVVLAVLGVLVALATAGCGVTPEQRPEPIEVYGTDAAVPSATGRGPATVDVYFVRGDRLARVSRAAPAADVPSALRPLLAGPTRAEVLSQGLRAALSPQPLDYRGARRTGSGVVARVEATEEFTSVSGGNQLLAVAQVVWTLTSLPDVDRVLITVDGAPIEVPTDEGLSGQPVGRGDYLTVAPPPPSTPDRVASTPTGSAGGDPEETAGPS